MKSKLLGLSLITATLVFSLFFSCKKDTSQPHSPTDSTSVVDLRKGLLLYLPFTGNFADSSGNNNPTTPLGGVALSSDPFGTANSAMASSGGWERVVVTNNGSIKFDSAFTFSANVLCRQQHDQSFVSMVKRATGQGVTFGLGYGIPGFNRVNFTVSNSNATCSDVTSAYNTAVDTSDLTMVTDQWYNLVVTFYKGTLKMYANGKLISTKTSSSPTVPICPGAEVIVGGWWDGPTPQGINGKMDEVRLYNRTLNDQEIAKLAQGFPVHSSLPVADLKKGLLLYLPFNGNIADSSGNNNPTTAVGGASLTYDAHGYANSAFGGTGNGERIVVTNNGSIKFDTAFTFSASVLSRTTAQQAFVSMVKRATGKGVTFGLGYGIPGITRINFTVSNNLATCDVPTSDANTVVDTSNLTLQPESWYNLVVIFHKGTLQMYANGQLISTKTGASPTVPICPGAELIIGGFWDGGNAESINGKMDNVRLYNRVLIPEEIALLAKNYQLNSNSIRQTVSH
ncbi:MAG: LamG domain-containing protein [Chitinophagaceae bacterium]|nr:LamG domain-containing protein [Chitinophagaceae bacterium]